ncbi:MAG TPA: septal ring lytic transglycosylase RlpA family protein [Bacillota bacterium]|nr:septal ring lytic transglycosylase RlpA family protein [Bacillota bacterium]HPT88392.1 septal ring lytic transglycosylase RlpA family protein [Bacillota bacterium]
MRKPVLFLTVLLLIFLVNPALKAEAAADIFSYVSGKSGFVVINQQPAIQLSGTYNGLTVAQRIKLVETRLEKIAATGGIQSDLLKITERNGHLGLTYKGEWLVLADPASAYIQKTTQDQLAERWRKTLVSLLPNISEHYRVVDSMVGIASWYGKEFRGRKTANGERYDERKYTAAHRSLKFGTRVRVTNLANNLSVIVIINDRGPWVKNRLIDLSWAAAQAIGIRGIAQVKVEVLSKD